MSLVLKTHGVLLCAMIKIIRQFEELRVVSKITPQAVANLAPYFLEIYSDSVFYNRTAKNPYCFRTIVFFYSQKLLNLQLKTLYIPLLWGTFCM